MAPEVAAAWIAAASAVISAIALVFSGLSLRADRRSREAEGIFALWERYEQYSQRHAEAVGTTEHERRTLINMLNFLENIASIYNNKLAESLVRKNIKAILEDFISMVQERASFYDVLSVFRTRPDCYDELEFFIRINGIKSPEAVTPPPAT